MSFTALQALKLEQLVPTCTRPEGEAERAKPVKASPGVG